MNLLAYTPHKKMYTRGFTLVELMVAVSLFAIVIMVGVGALLSMVAVNARAQAINSVMNNLNAAIEQISRSARVGSVFYCSDSAVAPSPTALVTPRDCASGGVLLAFEPSGGSVDDPNDQTVYRLNGTQLERSLCSGLPQACASGTKNGAWVAVTAPEVEITDFRFYVTGTAPLLSGDTAQPRILISVRGTARVQGTPTQFSVQSAVTQRLLDI